MLMAAVRSALGQSWPVMEVIVVLDGPDLEAGALLATLRDDRVRVLPLAAPAGGAEARNIGIRAARGAWVALLDDDDEWLPEKIATQIQALDASLPVVLSARFEARRSGESEILPRRLYTEGSVASYLFKRRSLRYGDGVMHTSTLVAPRWLLLKVPFTAALPRHQDWDLLLRLEARAGVRFLMRNEVLARVHMERSHASVSRGVDWSFSKEWARRSGLRGASLAWFLATECVSRAAKAEAPMRERLRLVQESLAAGGLFCRAWLLAMVFALR